MKKQPTSKTSASADSLQSQSSLIPDYNHNRYNNHNRASASAPSADLTSSHSRSLNRSRVAVDVDVFQTFQFLQLLKSKFFSAHPNRNLLEQFNLNGAFNCSTNVSQCGQSENVRKKFGIIKKRIFEFPKNSLCDTFNCVGVRNNNYYDDRTPRERFCVLAASASEEAEAEIESQGKRDRARARCFNERNQFESSTSTSTDSGDSSSSSSSFIIEAARSSCALIRQVPHPHSHHPSASSSSLTLTSSLVDTTQTGKLKLADATSQQGGTGRSLSAVSVTVVTTEETQTGHGQGQGQESSTMKEEKQLEFILKSLLAGGVAGMCAKSSVAPLDRMKILLQAHSKHYSHLGVFSGLKGIVQKESLLALYKGNGAQMVRIFPYAATQFTSFEMYKKFLGEDSHIARFAAGSMAGVTAVALTYPLDTIRARLAFQVTGEHLYNGIYSCAAHIFREEGGVRALYRGFIPTVCGMIPYAGLSFYCFESFKYMCMKYFPTQTCKSHSTNTGGLVLLLYAKLICGGVAGAAAQTVAYPLDVTRRRMQLAMMNEHTKKFGMGMVSTLKLIYQENGVMRGLYRGMSINYLRAIPMVAVSFSTYELVKQTLKLDTGLAIKTG